MMKRSTIGEQETTAVTQEGPLVEDTPPDFDEHIEHLQALIERATEDDVPLRNDIYEAIERLVINLDDGPWVGCRVAWTDDDIPDTLEGFDA